MVYESLFEKASKKNVKAALIGTGQYGTSLLGQIPFIERLDVPVICDKDPEALRKTCSEAGIPEEKLVRCGSKAEALKAIKQGKYALVEDGLIVSELPIDVIVECTGNPEDGARYSQLGIENGKHVVVVNKEMDSVIGPYLSYLAAQNGVVFTSADGDQPSLVVGLISWTRSIGLEVVAGGKSLEQDAIFNEETGEVTFGRSKTTLPRIPPKEGPYIQRQRNLYGPGPTLPSAGNRDPYFDSLCRSFKRSDRRNRLQTSCRHGGRDHNGSESRINGCDPPHTREQQDKTLLPVR